MDAARPKSHTGDYNIKRRFGKGFRNSKKNMMMFANRKKEEQSNESFEKYMSTTPHRSCSLNALHTGQDLLQPRMAQLETLEAKMARIENSLSTTPRKKKISTSNGSITSVLIGATNANLSNIINGDDCLNQTNIESKSNSLRSISTYSKLSLNGSNTPVYRASGDLAREMDTLKNVLKDKENVIDSLKGQLNTSLNVNKLSTSYLQSKRINEHTSPDKQVVEDRLEKLKKEMENKSLLIKNIKLELERLDITDNIDIRIQQAELEYQLGREELNLLSILEEIQSLKTCLEECETSIQQNENTTLFNFMQKKSVITLHSIELIYDAKSPRFGANISEDGNGLCVEWSAEDSGLIKGDRLLEINGKLTFNLKNREDMMRLLSVSPNPAQIVILRQNHRREHIVMSTLQEELKAYREKAGEAERIRDSFRSDNVRLTHRISYLEEQVAELLSKISKNELPAAKHSTEFVLKERKSEPKIQIFQKGSKVTVIGSIDSDKKMSKAEQDLPIICNKMRSKSESKLLDGVSAKDEKNMVSCSSRCDSNTVHFTPASSRESTTQIYSTETPKKKSDSTIRLNIKYSPESENLRNQHLNIINISSPNNYDTKNKENYYNLMNERRIKYIKDAQNSLLTCGTRSFNEYNHKQQFRDDRSCKSVDFDSEPNYQSLKNIYNGRVKMYDSETSSDYSRTVKYPRPIPPQKPLRLSLHKGCSLQSVKIIDKSSNNDNSPSKKYSKRPHKSEICINSNKEDDLDKSENKNKYTEKWC